MMLVMMMLYVSSSCRTGGADGKSVGSASIFDILSSTDHRAHLAGDYETETGLKKSNPGTKNKEILPRFGFVQDDGRMLLFQMLYTYMATY